MNTPEHTIEELLCVAENPKVDQFTRIRAVQQLYYTHGRHAIEPLIRLLGNENARVRSQAADSLGLLKNKKATGPLLEKLKDRSVSVRRNAAVALGFLGDPSAINILIPMLKHRWKRIQYNAVLSLGHIDDPRAVQALVNMLWDTKSELFSQAAYLLASKGKIEAVEPLIAAFDSKDPAVRESAVFALNELRDPRITQTLLTLLQNRELKLIAITYPFFIRQGIEGTEDILIEALHAFGSFGMANAFFHSGNPKLIRAGGEFYKAHGDEPEMYTQFEAKWRPRWGSEWD